MTTTFFRKVSILFFALILPSILFGQNADFNLSSQHAVEKFIQKQRIQDLELMPVNIEQTSNDLIHTKFAVHINGVPIFGYVINTLTKGSDLRFINKPAGTLNDYSNNWNITEEMAFQIALKRHNARYYAWESPAMEQIIRGLEHNSKASFFPSVSRYYIDAAFPSTSGNLIPAYHLIIYSLDPLSRKEYLISAEDGTILFENERIHSTEVEGIAHTKYSGVRSIRTDSLAPGHYILNEENRGGGIQTLNMRKSILYDKAVDFTDSNNVWDHFNDNLDEVATDAHWGMEMTYDFYNQKLGWKSFDNQDTKMLAYVHYSDDYVNAFWNGRWTTYGDGNKAAGYGPLVTLDVVGHEFTHGVVDYTADLIYRNEAGALNESFCDIMGASIEAFADTALFNWWIGEGFTKNGIRSMENPKVHGNPDTYHGQYWEFGTADNGGVHTNSGVQNKWFQLLSDGGSGVNDNGDAYQVTGIGIDSASRIAFQNLRYYLGKTSNYHDARIGAIQAALELYGEGSAAAQSVSDAWYAVGLGYPAKNGDLEIEALTSPLSQACQMTASTPLSIRIRNNSLLDTLTSGTIIRVSYLLDDDTLNEVPITLGSPVLPFQAFDLDSIAILDLSKTGKHSLTVIINTGNDPEARNDTFALDLQSAAHQTDDLRLYNINTASEFCRNADLPFLDVTLRYEGCDSFPGGLVPLYFLVDGDTIRDTANIQNGLYPGQNFRYVFKKPIPFDEVSSYNVTAYVDNPFDSNKKNNQKDIKIKWSMLYGVPSSISFEDYIKSVDSIQFITGRDAGLSIRGTARNKGLYGLFFTGGKVIESGHGYEIPDSSNVWDINARFSAKACICVDARNYPGAIDLFFDLKQSYSPAHENLVFEPLPYASSFRVTADGKQISPTYWPETPFNDTFRTVHLVLDTFGGKEFTLCFESRNLIADNDAVDTGKGDNAYLDNVRLRTTAVGIKNISEKKESGFKIYPNPIQGDRLFVQSTGQSNIHNILIYNTNGQVIYRLNTSKSLIALDLQNLVSGLYFIRISGDEKIETKTFVRVK